jgi:hypothetical protein
MALEVQFAAPELRRLDASRADALVLTLFEDERPLRGASGLVDWRLCGRLSSLLTEGRITGTRGETTLLPPRPRLPFDRLVLYGLGRSDEFDDDVCVSALGAIFDTLTSLRSRTCLLVVPGRATGRLRAERALDLLFDAVRGRDGQDSVTLLEPFAAQKVMLPLLEKRKKRR